MRARLVDRPRQSVRRHSGRGYPGHRRDNDIGQVAQEGGHGVAPGARDLVGGIEHRPAACGQKAQHGRVRAARQVRVAYGVEDKVIGRQVSLLILTRIFHDPAQAGEPVVRHQIAQRHIAALGRGRHKHRGPRSWRRLDKQIAARIGEIAVARGLGAPTLFIQQRRQVLVRHGHGGIEGQGLP